MKGLSVKFCIYGHFVLCSQVFFRYGNGNVFQMATVGFVIVVLLGTYALFGNSPTVVDEVGQIYDTRSANPNNNRQYTKSFLMQGQDRIVSYCSGHIIYIHICLVVVCKYNTCVLHVVCVYAMFVGTFCSLAAIVMAGSPLSVMQTILETKSSASLNIRMVVVNIFASLSWAFYGVRTWGTGNKE